MTRETAHYTQGDPATPHEAKRRVITGMRTTGRLHLGHYVGALKGWRRIQDEEQHEAFYLLANVQALTTHADKPGLLTNSVRDVTLDWLSVGMDPSLKRTNFVLQSQLPERYELSSVFMMLARHAEVMGNPTLKTELETRQNATMGFWAYPVDMTADIAIFSSTPPKTEDQLLVPTGADQAPHIELARLLTRRFNRDYGHTFVIPHGLIGEVGRLVGPDGKEKMGKSLGNTIDLADDAQTVVTKVKGMYTDPKRLRATDPGETENNPVFVYLRAFDPNANRIADLTESYQRGRVGDVEVKRILAMVINEMLEPIRERRARFANVDIREILVEGTNRARKIGEPVIEAVRERMHLKYPD